MHLSKKKETMQGRGTVSKPPVQGLLGRGTREKASRVRLSVIKGTKRADVQKDVRESVEKGSEVHTDGLRSYNGLGDEFTHLVVDHAVKYVDGHVHTNGLENFWSYLKRTIKGTYVSCEPFHLFRYLDEQAFRYNERKDDNHGRFLNVVGNIFGKRLTYKKLIGKDGDQGDRLALA